MTTSHFSTEREQATWQNALNFSADQQLVLAYEHLREEVSGDVFTDQPKRSNNAALAGYSGGFGPSPARSEPAPRRQLGLRQQHDRQASARATRCCPA